MALNLGGKLDEEQDICIVFKCPQRLISCKQSKKLVTI